MTAAAHTAGRWLRRHALLVDVGAAGLLVVLSLVALAEPPAYLVGFREPDALARWLAVVSGAAVALRSVAPVPAFVLAAAPGLAAVALAYPHTLGGVAALLTLYSVASRCSLRTSVLTTTAALLGVGAVLATTPFPVTPTDWVGNAFVLTTGWAVGRVARTHRETVAGLQERTRVLEQARGSEQRAAVVEERTRIAREMHDIVAHSLTAMTVQATAAQRVLRRDADAADQLLDGVQHAGRTALDELRRVLEVLGRDDAPATRTPQPGTADLQALVERVRAAGLAVALEQHGDPVPLDPGADLAAYRVVQESLTNALKHAGPARVRVVLGWTPGGLDIRVEDDGRGAAPAAAGTGTGRGLVLLRQRADAYGGSVTAGPRTGGGYALTARLPAAPR